MDAIIVTWAGDEASHRPSKGFKSLPRLKWRSTSPVALPSKEIVIGFVTESGRVRRFRVSAADARHMVYSLGGFLLEFEQFQRRRGTRVHSAKSRGTPRRDAKRPSGKLKV